jgi:hypothetical protein
MDVPEQVVVHLRSGAMRLATQRWALGTEIGFEFSGIAKLDAVAIDNALTILVSLHEKDLNDVITRLNEVRFFDDVELNLMALGAKAAMQRLEAMLRQRAEGSGSSLAASYIELTAGTHARAIPGAGSPAAPAPHGAATPA